MNWWHWFLRHFLQEIGATSSSSRAYNFWSGFGSDIAEFAIIGALVQVVRNLNCHEKGCWRLSRHTTASGHRLCKRHIAKPVDELHLHAVHPDHL